jgi:tetratricopeptide (TPR) repeat protein
VDAALADLDDVFKTAPGFAFGRLAQAYALLARRRTEEAALAVSKAVELDPLSPIYVYNQAVVAYFARQWDLAEAYGRATLELAPDFAEGHLALGVTAMETGRFDEALQHLRQAVALNATIGREFLPVCHCRMGAVDEAEAEVLNLMAFAQHGYVAPHRLAIATSAFPDASRSLAFLEQAHEQGDPRLVWLDAWPAFDAVRSQPRFQALVKRLGT